MNRKTRLLAGCFILIQCLGTGGLASAQVKGPTIEQRKAFPDIKIPFVEKSEDFSTSSFKGKVTVLFFWATWCQFCKARMPALPQIEAAFGKGQVQTMLLNMDTDLELAKKYLKEHPKVASSLFDRDLRIKKMASVRAIPYSLVIDQQGIVRFIQEGDRANEISILLRKVQKLVPKVDAK
jgi:thiol-disulfide isomerase/thioredoxin